MCIVIPEFGKETYISNGLLFVSGGAIYVLDAPRKMYVHVGPLQCVLGRGI